MFNRVPPLHLLIAFEAAARLGSFARAAEELSVTPSAVSHRIKNLEELWGEDLFVRANAALRLTAAGTRYLRNVQDALKSLNELARPEYIGTALTLQTCLGFLLTLVTIRLVPTVEGWAGWGWAFAALALGPAVGIGAMASLRRILASRAPAPHSPSALER